MSPMEAIVNPPSQGSRLDADHPQNGVLIPCRFTVVLSAGIRSPVQKPKERTLIGPAETPLNRATSSRNAGRNHLGTPSDIKSEWWATSSWIRGRLPPESADSPAFLDPWG